MSTPRVEAALAALRERGERVTPARRAVLSVVDAADRTDEHVGAEEIAARVATMQPAVHRATVYRALTSLAEAGVLSHVHVGGSGTVYHLISRESAAEGAAEGAAEAAAGGAAYRHLHVQCVSCGRVLDAPAHVLDEAAAQLRSTLGFELETTHAALLGRCADCAGVGHADADARV